MGVLGKSLDTVSETDISTKIFGYSNFFSNLISETVLTRVAHGRLTEPEPEPLTGVFGELTGTENRGSKPAKTENRWPKPTGFGFKDTPLKMEFFCIFRTF